VTERAVHDVAIVGLGPTGAMLANLLGAAGLSVVVLEKESGIFALPRAIHFDGEVLRILQGAGLRDAALAIARPGEQGMHFVNGAGETMLIRGGATALGPHGGANNYYFHQPQLEAVLREGLARFPNVDVRLRHEVLSVDQDADSAVLQVRDLEADRTSSVRARYVVGCDGARSPVRARMGSPMTDLGLKQPWLVFDVVLEKDVALPQHTVQHCDPARPMTYCNVVGNRRRWEIMVLPGDDREAMLRPEALWRLVAPWLRPDQARLERAAIYTFHSVIAQGWRSARLLLAGDACHQTPPFLGQGMCAGIRDAANLAWKLEAVLRRKAAPSLLDTYESERAPHVRALIELAVRLGNIIQTTDPALAAERDARFRTGRPEIFELPPQMLGAGAFDATVGAAYEIRGVFSDAKGRPIGLNLTQGETQDSKALSLFGRFGYELSPSARLDLIASRFELKGDGDYVATPGNRALGLPTSAVRGNPPGKSAQNRTESIALSLTDSDLGGGNFVSQIFFNRSRDTFGGEVATQATFQDVRIAPIGTLFDQSQNRSRKFGGKLSYERGIPGFEDLTLTLGFDALWDTTEQRLIATGRTWVPPTDFRSLAPFAQANLKLFDGLIRVAGGARYENVKITIDDYVTLATTTTPRGGVSVAGGSPTFDDVLINGGVIVEPIDGIRAYASYAEGFTVPDVGRITRAIGTVGVDIDTFLDISPIVSNNREIGFEVKRGPLDASASYFWSSSDKGQLLIARPDRIFDVQRLRVEIQGLELNLGVQTPIDGLKFNVGYAHLIGRFDSDAVPDGIVDSDLDGTNISPDRLNLAANYNSGPFSARIQTQVYFKRRFDGKARAADDANPLRPLKLSDNDFGGYTLTDAHVRYQTAIGGISLSVQNLFNKQYIDYSSDTRLPTDQLSYFAGRGRTFTLGWDYRF